MMQTPEKRNPGWRAGALESEAGATKFPETDISLEAHRAQRLIALHHVKPAMAVLLAPFAFGGGANV